MIFYISQRPNNGLLNNSKPSRLSCFSSKLTPLESIDFRFKEDAGFFSATREILLRVFDLKLLAQHSELITNKFMIS